MLEQIIFTHKEDAERVLAELLAFIDATGLTTLYEYYSAAGASPTAPDVNYGWVDLTGVSIQPASGTHYIDDGTQKEELGWMITLPEPVRINLVETN